MRWAEQARADFIRITTYYAAVAPDFPAGLLERIDRLTATLAAYPGIGAPLEGGEIHKVSVRGTSYILFYRVTQDAIEILRVFHARQDWRGA